MADTTVWLVNSKNADLIEIRGIIAATAGPGTPTKVNGRGWSVSTPDNITFTVTFSDFWPSFLGAYATVKLATPAGLFAQLGAYTPLAKTLDIVIINGGGVPTAMTTNAGDEIHFGVSFVNSSVPSVGT